MHEIKKKVRSKGKSIRLELPEMFRDKDLEIIVRMSEEEIDNALLHDKVKIDTTKWRFNREEIYND